MRFGDFRLRVGPRFRGGGEREARLGATVLRQVGGVVWVVRFVRDMVLGVWGMMD